MAIKARSNVLTQEFLMDLFLTAMEHEHIMVVVVEYLQKEYLPDRDFQALWSNMVSYFKLHKQPIPYSILKQSLSGNISAIELLEDIFDTGQITYVEQLLAELEEYIKQVKFQKIYKEVGELFVKQKPKEAEEKLRKYSEWLSSFSLQSSDFVDVIATFDSRFQNNKKKAESTNEQLPVTRFYIDDLDIMNNGRSLRKQLTCFLAATGVGKSHIARWVGKCACQADGLNGLHFQLEGSKEEAVDAYSASLVSCNSFRYEMGRLTDREVERMAKELEKIAGRIYVKSYPRFNSQVSTVDISNGISDWKKKYQKKLDVVLIDSADLLTDSSGRNWGEKGERLKRERVFRDLKDIAAEEDVWVVVTYQSTVEDRLWLNDESNVLTEYNTAEAKGVSRPLTHLITLNQSDNERKEQTLRLHIAKSRFFRKGETIKIATDYDIEQFYDRERTLNINKVNTI